MNRGIPYLAALLCLSGSGSLIPSALAASGGQTPTCYVNRYGVEKCGSDGNNGGDQYIAADTVATAPKPSAQARLQRYCAERKKAGKSSADGLCAGQAAGN